MQCTLHSSLHNCSDTKLSTCIQIFSVLIECNITLSTYLFNCSSILSMSFFNCSSSSRRFCWNCCISASVWALSFSYKQIFHNDKLDTCSKTSHNQSSNLFLILFSTPMKTFHIIFVLNFQF